MSQCEQRVNIKCCLNLGKTAAETLGCLQIVYGNETKKKTVVCDRFNRLKNGQKSLEDEELSGLSEQRTELSHVDGILRQRRVFM